MAKINRTVKENIWQVKITVNDPGCLWNINSECSFYKIIKANSMNGAVRGAANYCNRQMKSFPGTHFSYSTKEVEPYYYPLHSVATKENL
jgi:hypothetical protein